MAEDKESRDYYCEVIMDEANKMNTMVRQLLTLNALESGNDMVTMERFDLVELIHGVIYTVAQDSDLILCIILVFGVKVQVGHAL